MSCEFAGVVVLKGLVRPSKLLSVLSDIFKPRTMFPSRGGRKSKMTGNQRKKAWTRVDGVYSIRPRYRSKNHRNQDQIIALLRNVPKVRH